MLATVDLQTERDRRKQNSRSRAQKEDRVNKPFREPPPYVVTSVDNALRIAAMLQLETALTLTEVADRLGVAPSTAHRLLATLVYRDFAEQDARRAYRVGPVLELAARSESGASRLRAAALPHLRRLVDMLGESANLAICTGVTTRFIAGVESPQALRVGNREGIVLPAHQTTAGLLLLAELRVDEVEALYATERHGNREHEIPNLTALRHDLAQVRRYGFALNKGRSERGVVAIGVLVRGGKGEPVACASVSMPSVRYEKDQLPTLVATLQATARALERDLAP